MSIPHLGGFEARNRMFQMVQSPFYAPESRHYRLPPFHSESHTLFQSLDERVRGPAKELSFVKFPTSLQQEPSRRFSDDGSASGSIIRGKCVAINRNNEEALQLR